GSSAASSTAIALVAIAYLRYGSSRRDSFLSVYFASSKLRTSPAIRVGYPVASNLVMGPMPERAWRSDAQNSSAVLPTGVRAPTPVTTTRRGSPALTPRLSGVGFDVLDGVADRHDLL